MAEKNLIEQIRRRAYEIWASEGCPHGRDRVHWLRAEAEFIEHLRAVQPNASPKTLHERPKDGGSRRRPSAHGKRGPGRKKGKVDN